MSLLEKLLSELCPEGVPFKTLGEIGFFYGGLSGKSKEDFRNGNEKFITYMNIYSNIEVSLDIPDRVQIGADEKQNTVEYGDVLFTASSETQDECGISSVLTTQTREKLYLNSFCFGFRLHDPTLLLPGFSKYLFRSTELRQQLTRTASGVTRFNVSKKKMEKVKIPLPPLPVQREIVQILDNFTLLTAELTAELTARKKQYEYYRDQLLTFDECQNITGGGNRQDWVCLRDIAEIGTGSSNTNEELEVGDYPFFVRSQEVRRKNTFEFDETAIITSGDGVGVGKIYHFVQGKYALHQRAYRIHITDPRINPKYYFYYMKCNFLPYIERNSFHSSVTSIRRPMLEKFPIPVLSLEEQARIVSILDRFDALCNDLTSGLPAEIEARRKQYEYYRDKLLTFQEMDS